MRRAWHLMTVAAAVVGFGACQGGGEAAGEPEPPSGQVAPDRPAPAISNPSSPSPVGTDVGTVERDTSAGQVANDSTAIPGQ